MIAISQKHWTGDVSELLRVGGIAVSGLPLDHPMLKPLPVPASVPTDRYFLYRKI